MMASPKVFSSLDIAGDFNEILKSHEKVGGRPRPN